MNCIRFVQQLSKTAVLCHELILDVLRQSEAVTGARGFPTYMSSATYFFAELTFFFCNVLKIF